MSIFMSVNADNQLERIQSEIGGTEEDLNIAVSRAAIQFIRWAEGEFIKAAVDACGVSKDKLLKNNRVYIKQVKTYSGAHGSIWLGTNSIPADYSDSVVQSSGGLVINGEFYKSAFIGNARGLKSFQRRGKDRLPIDRVMMDIHDPIHRGFNHLQRRAEAMLSKLIERELNFVLRK